MLFLIFPPIKSARNLPEVEDTISREQPVKTLFLGNYFDSESEPGHDVQVTALWLKQSLACSDRIHLIGSGDLRFIHRNTSHDGWPVSPSQFALVGSILRAADWRKLKLYHWAGDVLLSHAGFTRELLPPVRSEDEASGMRDYLEATENLFWRHAESAEPHPVWGASHVTGSSTLVDGPVWCDFEKLTPTPYVTQICGRSPGRLAAVKPARRSVTVCLNTSTPEDGVCHYLRLDSDARRIEVEEVGGKLVNTIHLPRRFSR